MEQRRPNGWWATSLLLWYVLYSTLMAIAPVDREFWILANILPTVFVITLIGTYRRAPFSNRSYLLITIFLTLHVTGVHYTYAEVPFGWWLERVGELQRNHFDRIVHFCFGLLLTSPLAELFRSVAGIRGWLLTYLSVMTIMGLSGLWEIVEAWVAQTVRPDLGMAFVGFQGDLWDAQKDMALALAGSLLTVALAMLLGRLRRPTALAEPTAT